MHAELVLNVELHFTETRWVSYRSASRYQTSRSWLSQVFTATAGCSMCVQVQNPVDTHCIDFDRLLHRPERRIWHPEAPVKTGQISALGRPPAKTGQNSLSRWPLPDMGLLVVRPEAFGGIFMGPKVGHGAWRRGDSEDKDASGRLTVRDIPA